MTTASAVREHGLLISGPMQRANLAGTKRETRRVVTDHNTRGNFKPSVCDLSKAWVDPGPSPAGNAGPYLKAPVVVGGREAEGIIERLYPIYAVGDRIWFRENYRIHGGQEYAYEQDPASVVYQTDDIVGRTDRKKWRPSIHMPRWACRFVAEITRVSIERVQQITREGAIAEGVFLAEAEDKTISADALLRAMHEGRRDVGPIDYYREIWDRLNFRRGFGWDVVNPWVYVLGYRPVTS